MANLGCIELNPWLSRISNLDCPDYLVIDLDPEDIAFDRVVEAALAVKEVLDRAGAKGYPKTSGATGIHIYVPLQPVYDFDAVTLFARIIATMTHSLVPDFTSLERSPGKRQKKVYLDYLQNRKGQTLAAPYSIRPRKGAPVSTPLRWQEVRKGLDPLQFTMTNVHGRILEHGDLFRDVLRSGADIEECLKRLE
jgi:bifunctional non-homologous end joining protein LigD